MTGRYAMLIGFARPIPDVATFVIPIFVDDTGTHLVQLEVEGSIAEFQPVDVGEEFETISFKVVANVGDDALYAFETPTGSVLIGSADLLSRALQVRLLEATREYHNYAYTLDAIQKFVSYSFALQNEKPLTFPYLFELMQSCSGDSFHLDHIVFNQYHLDKKKPQETEVVDAFSIIRWEADIYNYLSNVEPRDSLLLGNTSRYFENIIMEWTNKGLARALFREALDNALRMWMPSRSQDFKKENNWSLMRILDLVTAYTPRYGFERIIELFMIPQLLESQISEPSVDLRLSALRALRRYFQAPPTEAAARPAFDRYVKLLWSQTEDARYVSHAAAVLMELRELRIDQPRLADLLKSQPKALHGILETIISEDWDRADQDTTALYDLCVKSNLTDLFLKHLSSLGGQIDWFSKSPTIRINTSSHKREIPLFDNTITLQAEGWVAINGSFDDIVDKKLQQSELRH